MKFSIVTPTYNSERFLAKTIESVLSQKGDFEIEHIIHDGGSSDRTVQIVSEYAKKIERMPGKTISWFSEKDNGMYDAINKGFAHATGDVYAYINSDDIYQPGAFQKIALTLSAFPEIEWIKGISSVIDENDKITRAGKCYWYDQSWIQKGIYGRNSFPIAQDAVFWRKSLWEKSGGCDPKYRLAGDYDLWIRFSKHAPLWSLNSFVSCFRKRPGQLSKNISAYKSEQEKISHQTLFTNFFVRAFFSCQSRSYPHFKKFFLWLYRLILWKKGAEYVDFENGKPVKRQIYSYIATKPE